jgi:hypothetical protein
MKKFNIFFAAILFMVNSKALFGQGILPQNFKTQSPSRGLATSAFEENKGQVRDYNEQTHNGVKYVFKQGGMQLFLMEKGIAYQFSKIHYPEGYKELKTKWKTNTKKEKEELLRKKLTVETFRMDMTLVGANSDARITSEGKSADYINYYNRDVLDVHSYTKLIYHDVYPGIDWVIYKNNEKIKYDFIVAPGADPSLIQMEFTYQEDLSLNKDGSFTLKNSMGTIIEKAPVSFQEEKKISTRFTLKNNVVSFAVGNYDAKQTLVIDPALLWGTYYGDNDEDYGNSCATDASGNVYLAGNTQSGANIASGGHQTNYLGNTDAFLVKFNSAGARQWATYYGGSGIDEGHACATDGSGNVYLTGLTASNSGISSGGHQNTYGGQIDAFLAKFNGSGTRQWATYYGGIGDDYGYGVASDVSGNIYLAGATESSNNIATTGAVNPSINGPDDAFVAKFNSSGVRQWATYYGDIDYDEAYSTATDASGNVYLCGYTESSSGIAFNGYQNSFGGYGDAFLVKLDGSGSLQWATYYGDSQSDNASGCATDASGNVYLAGTTDSQNNIASGGHQTTFGGLTDAFLVKFNASGARQWGTYYGGGSQDDGGGCATDASGNVYLSGRTASLDDMASSGYQVTWGGQYDAFLAKFNGSGTRQWGTYYGGNDDDYAGSCATNGNGDVFLAGASGSTMAIASGGGFQNTYGGGFHDAFLAKFINCTSPPAVSAIAGSSLACFGGSTYSVNPDPNISSYAWFYSDGTVTSSGNTATVMPNQGFGLLTVAAFGTCGFGPISTMTLNVSSPPSISVNSSEPVFCTGMTTILSASGANSYTWTGGGNGSTYAVSPNTVAVYTVTGTNNGYGCNGIATYTVIPNTNTAYNYTLSGMSLTLAINSSNCSSFQWDYGNGGGSTINSNPVVTYQNPGTYGVCLKCMALPNGCVRCINITMPGNMIGGVGIAEIENTKELRVYPNPSNGEFFIESQAEMQIELYTSLGQLILQKQLEPGKNKVDLAKEAKGIYFIKMKDAGGMKSITLVKEGDSR